MRVIGIDIGGTTTRLGLLEVMGGKARVLERVERPTVAFIRESQVHEPSTHRSLHESTAAYRFSLDALLDWIAAQIRRLQGERVAADAPHRVGLAVPGVIDVTAGVVIRSVNVPFLQGAPLCDRIRRLTGMAVKLHTDIAAATWAEYQTLAPACRTGGSPPLCMGHLRLGTGVGYAQIEHARWVELHREPGRHLDVLRVSTDDAESRVCSCGLRGCLEAYVSRTALAVTQDDRQAQRMAVIKAVINVVSRLRRQLGPAGVLVIGGGMLHEHGWLADALFASCDADNPSLANVVPASSGDDAGLIGAGLLAVESMTMT